jgi:hypothetical protein
VISNGLPPGTTLELVPVHNAFVCAANPLFPLCSILTPTGVCEGAGGSLSGEVSCAVSTVEMTITGTGSFAFFNRTIAIPINWETHSGPRTPFNPIQTFATEMVLMGGAIFGDPDFDTLKLRAGSAFSLPDTGPGETTLTQLPGTDWNVYSFFDVAYEIEFVGAFGSVLENLSGISPGTLRIRTGSKPVQAFAIAPGGPSGLASEFIYINIGGFQTAIGAGPKSSLGPGDAIDGFSDDKGLTEFSLRFSVDAASVGAPLAPTGVGPNVFDQGAAGNQQAAGDAFVSTEAFSRAGIIAGFPPSPGLFNNALVINQSPTYVNSFELLPVASPGAPLGIVPLDDVVGGGSPTSLLTDLYFTLDAASPALTGAYAGFSTPSGADIFFDPTPDDLLGVAGDETLFASAIALGLLTGDEIDGLVVFDDDDDGVFGGTDQVLFSLAAGSPTLILLGASPADVLSITFGGVIGVYGTATEFGLDVDDELNMLELPEPGLGLQLALGVAFLVGVGRRRMRR